MSEVKIITPKLLRSWNPCSDGYKRFCQLFPEGADLETAMKCLIDDNHDDWAYWLFNNCRIRKLFSEIVIRGYRNSGYRNSGNWNSGYWNSGDWNSGDWNSGHRNSGNGNSGHWNSGHWNSGHRNSGHWNSGHRNSGFFNSRTPEIIFAFNKPCNRVEWEEAHKPDFLFFAITEWIKQAEMSEDEKQANPSCSFTGGYLRVKEYKQAWREAWEKADKKDRERVKELPNFDAEVFFEITGIDLR